MKPGSQNNQKEIIIQSKYKIVKKIGNGSFGSVYEGIKLRTNESVAIKLERLDSSFKILKHETTLLNYLYQNGCRCSPVVYWYGIFNGHSCLIMPKYICSIDVFIEQYCKGSQKHINKIMVKLIELLENIHSHYVVHRDIKPQNFMIGNDEEIHLIDFGLSSLYVDEHKQHIKMTNKLHIIGTLKYVSYFVHCGLEPVRRDDLMSLGYMYIYLLTDGKLSWNIQNMTDTDHITINEYPDTHIDNYKNVWTKNLKHWDNFKGVCENIGPVITNYFEYCYNLGFSNNPNYSELKKIFTEDSDNTFLTL